MGRGSKKKEEGQRDSGQWAAVDTRKARKKKEPDREIFEAWSRIEKLGGGRDRAGGRRERQQDGEREE